VNTTKITPGSSSADVWRESSSKGMDFLMAITEDTAKLRQEILRTGIWKMIAAYVQAKKMDQNEITPHR
jgi:hypothetical protein